MQAFIIYTKSDFRRKPNFYFVIWNTPRFCFSQKTRPPFSCWKPHIPNFMSGRTHDPLRWRHNGRESVSNHLSRDCLLNRLFRRRSKKTSKLRVTGLCARNSPGTGDFPHKWPVTRKMFPFDDVIMYPAVIGCNVDTRLPCRTFAPPPVSAQPSYLHRQRYCCKVCIWQGETITRYVCFAIWFMSV